ncbi:hypothetical protein CBG46_09890 [Actinobacillus succinogenes]|uniref:Phage tape measure protein n=1 Tax=Actinobacillus succinogenes (strain ATCC 55618 / DSM 22257 / CCUG 43843 / 130Z) TaxID=339671 RepID=A6VNR2_ACTSZ|nr:tape measure protein [Actinobacillus succinogenes]ABR74609.1 phage tape measure protein [Actinobacillus succinogenes 130Z]PHI40966.1 hypothetical protein CBG46_09890 [Actinobacillus succinogenes]
MSSLGELNIQLALDTVEFQNGLTRAQYKARQFSDRTTQYLNNIERAANNINRTANFDFWGGNLVSGAKSLVNVADGYTEISNKMNLVSSSSTESAARLQTVFDISLKTNQSVQATSDVYQRFAQNAQALGISQAQVASLTETVSKAVAVSGASAASAQAALMQFGQSLASGVFRGQEFNSVMEQTPGLAQAIARGLGVTTGELRAMANDGKLTTDVLIPALEKAKASVDSQFASRILTVSAAFENLNSATMKWIGDMDNATGVTQGLASAIQGVSGHLTLFAGAAASVVAGLGVGKLKDYVSVVREKAEATITATVAQANLAVANREAAQQAINLAQLQREQARTANEIAVADALLIQRKATLTSAIVHEKNALNALNVAKKQNSLLTRGMSSVVGYLGGPVGMVTTVLGIGAAAWFDYSQKTEEAHKKALAFANDLPTLTGELEKLTAVQLAANKAKAEESIIEQQKEIKKLENTIKDLEKTILNTPKLKIVTDDTGYQIEIDNSSKISQLTRDLAKTKAELQTAQEKLNATQEASSEIADQLALKTEQMIGFVERYRDLTITSENRIDSWAQAASSAVSDFDGLAVSVDGLSGALRRLSGMSIRIPSVETAPTLSDAAKQLIDKSKLQAAIQREKDPKKKAKLQAKDYVLSLDKSKFSEYDIAQIQTQKEDEYLANSLARSEGKKAKGRENARESWLSFYDEIRQKSSSSLGEIDLEEQRMFQRLEEHMKKGVVSHTEYETAKLAISERFAKERLELAGKYAPEKLLSSNLKDELSAIEELRKAGQLTDGEAQTAEYQLKFDYAQSKSQSAVNPLDQMRALYDPRQELANQQTQELAQLQAFYEQKLMNEEEFQRRKKEIIDTYRNQQFQEDMAQYATGLNDLGSAFDVLASSVEASAGKQSAAYKAMFAISKAFAIAEATVKLSQAVAQAMADTTALTPAQKFANMASVAAAGANVISQITSVAFAKGGHVVGDGTGTSDSILARLSNNEFVMTSRTVDHYGVGFLNALNQRKFPKFANGGHVGGRSPSYADMFNGGAGGETNNEVSITINIDSDGNTEMTAEQKAAQGKELANAIQANVLEVLKKQRRPGGLLA